MTVAGFDARTIHRLVFADDMAGLVVRAAAPSMREILDISKLADVIDLKNVRPEDVDKVMPVFEIFADALVEWNVELSGEPVDTSLDGVLSLDMALVMRVVDAWMRAVTNVPVPLAKPSDDGATFPEASIPMESLSPSLAS